MRSTDRRDHDLGISPSPDRVQPAAQGAVVGEDPSAEPHDPMKSSSHSSARDAYIEHLRAQYRQGALRATLLEQGGPVPEPLRSALFPQVFPGSAVYS